MLDYFVAGKSHKNTFFEVRNQRKDLDVHQFTFRFLCGKILESIEAGKNPVGSCSLDGCKACLDSEKLNAMCLNDSPLQPPEELTGRWSRANIATGSSTGLSIE